MGVVVPGGQLRTTYRHQARCLLVMVVLALLLLSGTAWASPTRILVAVGHGSGHEDERPLRYAEQDAVKVVGAFTSLGECPRTM